MSNTDITEDYPNEGSSYAPDYYEMPAERREQEAKEAGPVAASYPIMAEVAAWFNEQIAECDKISNIDLHGPVPASAQVLAHQKLRLLLVERSRDWQRFIEEQ